MKIDYCNIEWNCEMHLSYFFAASSLQYSRSYDQNQTWFSSTDTNCQIFVLQEALTKDDWGSTKPPGKEWRIEFGIAELTEGETQNGNGKRKTSVKKMWIVLKDGKIKMENPKNWLEKIDDGKKNELYGIV